MNETKKREGEEMSERAKKRTRHRPERLQEFDTDFDDDMSDGDAAHDDMSDGGATHDSDAAHDGDAAHDDMSDGDAAHDDMSDGDAAHDDMSDTDFGGNTPDITPAAVTPPAAAVTPPAAAVTPPAAAVTYSPPAAAAATYSPPAAAQDTDMDECTTIQQELSRRDMKGTEYEEVLLTALKCSMKNVLEERRLPPDLYIQKSGTAGTTGDHDILISATVPLGRDIEYSGAPPEFKLKIESKHYRTGENNQLNIEMGQVILKYHCPIDESGKVLAFDPNVNKFTSPTKKPVVPFITGMLTNLLHENVAIFQYGIPMPGEYILNESSIWNIASASTPGTAVVQGIKWQAFFITTPENLGKLPSGYDRILHFKYGLQGQPLIKADSDGKLASYSYQVRKTGQEEGSDVHTALKNRTMVYDTETAKTGAAAALEGQAETAAPGAGIKSATVPKWSPLAGDVFSLNIEPGETGPLADLRDEAIKYYLRKGDDLVQIGPSSGTNKGLFTTMDPLSGADEGDGGGAEPQGVEKVKPAPAEWYNNRLGTGEAGETFYLRELLEKSSLQIRLRFKSGGHKKSVNYFATMNWKIPAGLKSPYTLDSSNNRMELAHYWTNVFGRCKEDPDSTQCTVMGGGKKNRKTIKQRRRTRKSRRRTRKPKRKTRKPKRKTRKPKRKTRKPKRKTRKSKR